MVGLRWETAHGDLVTARTVVVSVRQAAPRMGFRLRLPIVLAVLVLLCLPSMAAGSVSPLLGVIANGAKAGGSDAYYSRDRGSSGAVAADDGASSSPEELAPTAGG